MRVNLKKILNGSLKLIVVILIGICVYYLYLQHTANKRSNWLQLAGNFSNKIYLNSYCKCRPKVSIERHNIFENVYKKDDYYIIFENGEEKKTVTQLLEKNLLQKERVFINPRFTCDLNHVLSHGPNKKVIGYSLYGTHVGYSRLFGFIAQQAKVLFPDWIIRVYYDDTIDKSIICQLECNYDTIHFCHVNKIPFKNTTNIDLFSNNLDSASKSMISNDLSHVHGMMW